MVKRHITMGRFADTIFEIDTLAAECSPRVRVATVADVPALSSLVSKHSDNSARILAGDLCLFVVELGSDEPMGVVWVNAVGHTDRFAGRWSRPDPGCA